MFLHLVAVLLAAQGAAFPPLAERVAVLIFVRTDCPISNRYAPEIQRIAGEFQDRGVAFRLVYPETGANESSLDRHRREYGYTIPGILDPKHLYVEKAGVQVTPEVAVFVRGRLVYRGRIDNRFVSFGRARPSPTVHDLEQVLAAIVAGRTPRESRTKAIGCAIEVR